MKIRPVRPIDRAPGHRLAISLLSRNAPRATAPGRPARQAQTTAASWLSRRRLLSSSATRKASSSAWLALSRGSQAVW